MKKLLAMVFLGIICLFVSIPSVSASVDELDAAIRDASDYLNKNVPKGSKIVFLNIQSSFPALSNYIIDELIANAVNDKVFSVVNRQQLDIIRSEQKFLLSGDMDDTSALAMGLVFGAQTVVSGDINKLGTGYRIRIRALQVQTSKVQGQYNKNISLSPMLAALTGSGGSSTSTATSSRTTQTTQSAAQAAPAPTPVPAPAVSAGSKAYKVGDIGPAGGFIFYDKGSNSSGWRYLEAAPVEAEFQAVWSIRGTSVENTQVEIGNGKRNTQFIVDTFKQTSGEWDTAAQKVNELVFGGFNDWFMPSRAELDQMYGNLKRKNLGEFKNEFYWSSTENGGSAYDQNFRDGRMDYNSKGNKRYVRPIRQVVGP
jgi:TolB-like protein